MMGSCAAAMCCTIAVMQLCGPAPPAAVLLYKAACHARPSPVAVLGVRAMLADHSIASCRTPNAVRLLLRRTSCAERPEPSADLHMVLLGR